MTLATQKLQVRAILSLLGDGPTKNAATRAFIGLPVLRQTIERVVDAVGDVTVLCWDDQAESVRHAVGDVNVRSLGRRAPSASLQAISAALRWSGGWRGGLLGATDFDRGIDVNAILNACDGDAVLLVNPSAALIESETLASLVEHLEARPDQGYAFAPGAPGTGAMLIRKSTLEDLARTRRNVGSLLSYHPDRPTHDPLAKEYALPVPASVARSPRRATVDSDRQIARLATSTGSARLALAQLHADDSLDAMPREVVIELTTRRATKPIWSLASVRRIERPDLSLETADAIFRELAAVDDIRITFAGVGDPLLHPQFDQILASAHAAGISAIHVETDLLPADAKALDALASGVVDIVSFHLPAVGIRTYAALMGADRMSDVLANVKRLLLLRGDRGTPIVVPVFTKCEENLGEMETWYDQWIRAIGTASIVGPSDVSGRVPYRGTSDMTPGTRGPCRRLRSRLTILSDGTIAGCEEDVLGEQACGHARDSIQSGWNDGLSMLRSLHDERRWDESALCRTCRMWDRP